MPIRKILEALRSYEELLLSLGLQIDRAAIRRHTTQDLGYRGPMKTFFSESHAARYPNHTAPAEVYQALEGLVKGALKLVRSRLNGSLPKSDANPDAVIAASRKLKATERSAIAAVVMGSDHGAFVRRQEISIGEFRSLLADYAQGQTLARKGLIEHIQEEFRQRNIDMSFDTIEERFRSTTTVKTMPACIVDIIAALGDQFRTGLIAMEEMCGDQNPKAWLEQKRQRYFFKSASAMHKAIAERTGLRYDSIHKALGSRMPARRIQKDVKDCLDRWEQCYQAGEDLGVKDGHRGVPITEVQPIFDRLRGRYGNNGAIKDELAVALGVSGSWIQRYMAKTPRVKYMPMRHYAKLLEIADAPGGSARVSYLQDTETRALAQTLCRQANHALARAQSEGDPEKALASYKQIRRQLIEVLKQRRAAPEISTEVEPGDGVW